MDRPATLLDLRDWAVIRLAGADAAEFLQGVGTQEIGALRDGAALPTFFLTDKGRPLALAWVARGPDLGGFTLLVEAGARQTILPHLERLRVMEEVAFTGPDDMPCLYGVGGRDRDRAAREWASALPGCEVVAAEPATFLLLPQGFRPQPPPSEKEGRPGPIPPPASHDEAEAWRVAVGLPRAGTDFDLERIVTELSYPEAISLTKGCFVGQEVVARTTNRGAVRRRRIGFRYPGESGRLAHGTEIRAGGSAAGFVTSAAIDPAGRGLGMGYLAAEAPAASGDVTAATGALMTPLEVAAWPL